jgi:hypothetical protein
VYLSDEGRFRPVSKDGKMNDSQTDKQEGDGIGFYRLRLPKRDMAALRQLAREESAARRENIHWAALLREIIRERVSSPCF